MVGMKLWLLDPTLCCWGFLRLWCVCAAPIGTQGPFYKPWEYPVSVRAGSTVTRAVCGDSAGLVEWPRKVRKLSSFHTPSHRLCFLCLFFVFNLKESRLPAAQNTGELSEKLVPVSPKQVSPVCARGF